MSRKAPKVSRKVAPEVSRKAPKVSRKVSRKTPPQKSRSRRASPVRPLSEQLSIEQQYEALLAFCKQPFRKSLLRKLRTPVLDWIYPLSKRAVEKGIEYNTNKIIVDFYENKYF